MGEPTPDPDEEPMEECLPTEDSTTGELEHCVNSTAHGEYTLFNCKHNQIMSYSAAGQNATDDELKPQDDEAQEVRAARTAIGDSPVSAAKGNDASNVYLSY